MAKTAPEPEPDEDDAGACGCGAVHSDEERRGAVQAALDAKHKAGKKAGRFDGPRVHEMYPTHAIVTKGGFHGDEGFSRHGYQLAHAKGGKLEATVGPAQAVRRKWESANGDDADAISAQIMKRVSRG